MPAKSFPRYVAEANTAANQNTINSPEAAFTSYSLDELPLDLIRDSIFRHLDGYSQRQLANTSKKYHRAIGICINRAFRNAKLVATSDSVFFYNLNQIYACGGNQHGQLGLDLYNKESQVSNVYKLKENVYKFKEINGLEDYDDIVKIIPGMRSTFVLYKDGTLLAAGNNLNYQFGLSHCDDLASFTKVPGLENHSDIVEVVVEYKATFIRCKDGILLASGCNEKGKLGFVHQFHQKKFIKVPGIEHYGGAALISTNGDSTFIRSHDGTVLAVGANDHGQLGLGHTTKRHSFTVVPGLEKYSSVVEIDMYDNQTFIRCQDGVVLASGYNKYGQMGLGHNTDQVNFTVVPGLEKYGGAAEIIIGSYFIFIHCQDGTVLASGYNMYGQLGLGHYENQSTFTVVPGLEKYGGVAKIITGNDNTFIRCQDGTVLASGESREGQLGLGQYKNQNTFTVVPGLEKYGGAVEIITGYNFTFIRCQDGTVLASGRNNSGQLGLGHTDKQNRFVKSLINQLRYTILTPYDSLIKMLEKEINGFFYSNVCHPNKALKLKVLKKLAAHYQTLSWGEKQDPQTLKDIIEQLKASHKWTETTGDILKRVVAGRHSETAKLLASLGLLIMPEKEPSVVERMRALFI